MQSKDELALRIGGLLYTPALNTGIVEKLETGAIPCLTALSLCLEDSIQDEALPQAEQALKQTLHTLRQRHPLGEGLPLLFVRVRTPQHLEKVHRLLEEDSDLLTGYILPKFDLSNCQRYVSLIRAFNAGREKTIHIMPILESKMIADVEKRIPMLLSIKETLDGVRDYVLNVRVGGNDFSNLYGLRRSIRQNIYQVGVIRDILMDILNVFAADYTVSGPVWEYFGADPEGEWARGLKNELELDLLNGFTGKTAIHPSQLPIIYNGMKVRRADYQDAMNILGWQAGGLGVAKSADGSRMNEVKCHGKWARKILLLGDIYGFQEE
ncbi:MAG: ATP/GTP-binding protein [Clostridiales bacterium]|nr:ATP/GTP-binding protein [Clostridiales bacterium]